MHIIRVPDIVIDDLSEGSDKCGHLGKGTNNLSTSFDFHFFGKKHCWTRICIFSVVWECGHHELQTFPRKPFRLQRWGILRRYFHFGPKNEVYTKVKHAKNCIGQQAANLDQIGNTILELTHLHKVHKNDLQINLDSTF